MPNIYAGTSARQRRIPHVVSPRGMLSEAALQVSARSKNLFWHLAQKSALEGSACFHATSPAECADIRKFGIKAPVAIIPNGIDLPKEAVLKQAAGCRVAGAQRTLLYLGRIHPVKGLDDLVAAWSKVEASFADWHLRIVGHGEPGRIRHLHNVIEQLGVRRVSIESPAFDAEKWRLIFAADLSILPSHTENFGNVVAESLACGKPVIATRRTPWKELETQKCGWWIDSGPASIETALRVALGTPVQVLDLMGARGAAWVKQAFSWDDIAEEMARVYRWLCSGAAMPDCIVLD
jgi:glycosyltransferase involved in cell wall biosynthesis